MQEGAMLISTRADALRASGEQSNDDTSNRQAFRALMVSRSLRPE